MRIAWMQGMVVALVLAFAGAAGAQTVQKCVARGGHARYQSAPCARGERTAEVWDATPEPVPVPVAARTARAGRTRASRGAARSPRSESVRTAVQTTDACADARAYRDLAERRAGLARNYELLSTLQRRVFDACR